MIEEGDGTWEKRMRWGRCPKCDTMLPDPQGDKVQCRSCKLSIHVRSCTYCRDGMVREPDGYGCVQWTTCHSCDGRGWHP